jgi:hypothetical protein
VQRTGLDPRINRCACGSLLVALGVRGEREGSDAACDSMGDRRSSSALAWARIESESQGVPGAVGWVATLESLCILARLVCSLSFAGVGACVCGRRVSLRVFLGR